MASPFDPRQVKKLRELLMAPGPIAITSHHNPDGDAIGASLALFHYFREVGRQASVIVPNDFPGFLKWLPGAEEIIVFSARPDLARTSIESSSTIFCVDYNALHRTGNLEDLIRRAKAPKVLVDHHLQPALEEFDIHLTWIRTSSTAELVFMLKEAIGGGEEISPEAAEALFVGIMTDTGSFSYACNYPQTFEIAARLIALGVDAEKVHRKVYDTFSENRLRLLGYALSQKLTVLPELSTAYIALSRKELERFKHQVGDTEGLVNYALSVEGVKLAVLLTERKDRVRLSLRSKGSLSVNQIAREHFNGGGHQNAAGGDIHDSLDNAVKKLTEILPQYKGEIDRSAM